MSAPFTTAQVTFVGNGVNKTFPFGFPVYNENDIEVFLTDITTGEDTQKLINFTVTLTPPEIIPTTGSVNFPDSGTAIDSNTKLTVRRVTPYSQEFLDLGRNTLINAGVLEDAIDRVVGMIQQNQTLNIRSLKIGITESEQTAEEFFLAQVVSVIAGAVIDNLLSTSPTNALSANQGFILKGLVDAINDHAVINDLLSTSAVDGLSANQGRILKNLIDSFVHPVKSVQAENEAGTDDAKFVSPLGIRQAFFAVGGPPVFAVRTWISLDLDTVLIKGSGNVSTISPGVLGVVTINFLVNMPDLGYGVVVTVNTFGAGGGSDYGVFAIIGKFVSSVTIQVGRADFGAHTVSVADDMTDISVFIIR